MLANKITKMEYGFKQLIFFLVKFLHELVNKQKKIVDCVNQKQNKQGEKDNLQRVEMRLQMGLVNLVGDHLSY